MTEEDTFNKLKRCTFEDAWKEWSRILWISTVIIPTDDTDQFLRNELKKQTAWTYGELQNEYRKRYYVK